MTAKTKVTQKFTKKQASLGIVLLEDWMPVPASPDDLEPTPTERFIAEVPPGGGTWQLGILRPGYAPFLMGAFKAPSKVIAQRPVAGAGELPVRYVLYQIA